MLHGLFHDMHILFRSGNFVGQLPYTPGPPCTKCASGQGWCYKNLCSEYTFKVSEISKRTIHRKIPLINPRPENK